MMGREPFIAAVMTVAIYARKPRKEEKAPSHHHANVHYFKRDKIEVTFTIAMSFLHGK